MKKIISFAIILTTIATLSFNCLAVSKPIHYQVETSNATYVECENGSQVIISEYDVWYFDDSLLVPTNTPVTITYVYDSNNPDNNDAYLLLDITEVSTGNLLLSYMPINN